MNEPKPTRRSTRPIARAAISEAVDKIEAQDRALAKVNYKITDAQFQWALERLSSGDTMANVTSHLGLSRSALLVKAHEDPAFAQKFQQAVGMGTWLRLERAADGLAGGESSTGSIERDKAVADFAKWMAARLNRNVFGDRLQIDQRQVIINLPPELDGI